MYFRKGISTLVRLKVFIVFLLLFIILFGVAKISKTESVTGNFEEQNTEITGNDNETSSKLPE